MVSCFQCGIGLQDFRLYHVPLIEHVRHSAVCHLLLEPLGPAQFAEYKVNNILIHAEYALLINVL